MARPQPKKLQEGTDPKKEKAAAQPAAAHVADFHTNSDLDSGPGAQHHTIGSGPNQAAPGSHVHDGTDSPLLLSDGTISGARGSTAYYQSIEALLVRLGAQNGAT